MKRLRFVGCLIVTILFIGACDGSQDNSNGKKAQGEETAPGAVSRVEDVQKATIQIEGKGSFRNPDPEVGLEVNLVGRGSGFIIDPSGIAVTNNHVVTGMGSIEVFLNDESYNAEVLGVSECSDLAVIDIEGEGYPYLEWRQGEVSPGLDVAAAGFPLGDPEYTFTKGNVSKAEANGETSWSSVDSVLEHTATINPGNSGGPLVEQETGKVVGVNYAGDEDVNQYFAISGEEALGIIDQLREGQDLTSIGVNGVAPAIADEEGQTTGVWVSSVKSGSPADKAGMKAGDIITKLEGVELATQESDGPMADYCDILRTHGPDDTLGIEVVRFDTQEVLDGQLNGRKLKQAFSFAPEASEELESAEGETTTGETYSGYMTVNDDTGALAMEVPSEWSAVNGSSWLFEEEVVGPGLTAAPDLDTYNNTWEGPGVFFAASSSLAQEYSVEGLLDYYDFSQDCQYDARYDYQDPAYTGKYDLWANCGGGGTNFLVLVAFPEDQSYITLVQISVVSEADIAAAEQILNTFKVVGDV